MATIAPSPPRTYDDTSATPWSGPPPHRRRPTTSTGCPPSAPSCRCGTCARSRKPRPGEPNPKERKWAPKP